MNKGLKVNHFKYLSCILFQVQKIIQIEAFPENFGQLMSCILKVINCEHNDKLKTFCFKNVTC